MDFKENFNERLEELTESLAESDDTYAYIKSVAKYYWKEKKKFFRPQDVANNIMATNKELNGLRSYGIIESYDDVCYYAGGRAQCLNLLDEYKILTPSDTPILHPLIQELIENVCGKKQENIEYIHKAILYKYTHLNDFTLPAVVFYGT